MTIKSTACLPGLVNQVLSYHSPVTYNRSSERLKLRSDSPRPKPMIAHFGLGGVHTAAWYDKLRQQSGNSLDISLKIHSRLFFTGRRAVRTMRVTYDVVRL